MDFFASLLEKQRVVVFNLLSQIWIWMWCSPNPASICQIKLVPWVNQAQGELWMLDIMKCCLLPTSLLGYWQQNYLFIYLFCLGFFAQNSLQSFWFIYIHMHSQYIFFVVKIPFSCYTCFFVSLQCLYFFF